MSGATTNAFEADHRDTADGDQKDVPSSLNWDCLCHITGQLALADLLTATRLNRAYRDAAGALLGDRYPPYWVPLSDLYDATCATDPVTGRSRGWFALTAKAVGASP